jgi:hypothetical protein
MLVSSKFPNAAEDCYSVAADVFNNLSESVSNKSSAQGFGRFIFHYAAFLNACMA